MTPSTQRGFSMPELLVSLLVFATISAAAVYVLRLSVDARDQLEAANERLAGLEIARSLIKDDLAQVAIRPVRDEYGYSAGPAFQGGEVIDAKLAQDGEARMLALVRRGWANPELDAPRSTLQYVEYILRDDELIRRTRPYVDDARNQPRSERLLLSGVRSMTIGFLRGETSRGLDWLDLWPAASDDAYAPPPRAIEITIETDRYGELTQLFWIGEIVRAGRPANGA